MDCGQGLWRQEKGLNDEVNGWKKKSQAHQKN